MNEFAFADIIILALIALFVALKLRNTLGKDVGHRPDLTELRRHVDEELAKDDKVISMPGGQAESWPDSRAEAEEKALLAELEDSGVASELEKIRAADEQFRVKEFLDGARVAFEWVLGAFNHGEKDKLKDLMSDDVYAEFASAMDERLASGNKVEATLVSIKKADIIEASLQKKLARITVAFTTEQIIVERDAEGKIVQGDASHIQIIDDEWVFERILSSRNPNWMIVDI